MIIDLTTSGIVNITDALSGHLPEYAYVSGDGREFGFKMNDKIKVAVSYPSSASSVSVDGTSSDGNHDFSYTLSANSYITKPSNGMIRLIITDNIIAVTPFNDHGAIDYGFAVGYAGSGDNVFVFGAVYSSSIYQKICTTMGDMAINSMSVYAGASTVIMPVFNAAAGDLDPIEGLYYLAAGGRPSPVVVKDENGNTYYKCSEQYSSSNNLATCFYIKMEAE